MRIKMEKETVILFIVALIVIAAIASFVYYTYYSPKATIERGARNPAVGQPFAPVPFKPLGKTNAPFGQIVTKTVSQR